MQITAQQIKTRGTAIIEEEMGKSNELVLSVRGEPKYVIINIDTYNKYREFELEQAILESKREIKSGKYSKSINKHIKQIKDEL